MLCMSSNIEASASSRGAYIMTRQKTTLRKEKEGKREDFLFEYNLINHEMTNFHLEQHGIKITQWEED